MTICDAATIATYFLFGIGSLFFIFVQFCFYYMYYKERDKAYLITQIIINLLTVSMVLIVWCNLIKKGIIK